MSDASHTQALPSTARRSTSVYVSGCVYAPWHAAAKAQGLSKSEWLEEVILLTAPLLGSPQTRATAAAKAWVRLRQAGHRGASRELQHWACATGELTPGTVALLTDDERQALGLAQTQQP